MPIFWWIHTWVHVRFIVRELTSVFVAGYVVVLLLQIRALGQGPSAYSHFEAWLQTPFALAVHSLALLLALFHSATWLNLAPKAMALRVGGKQVPARVIVAANFLAWGAASAGLAWFIMGA